MTALRVVIDGASLPDADARALWKRFSDWMEEHPGDLGGFASAEGLASVHPEMQAGAPVLIGSLTAPQRPYTTATTAPLPAGAGRLKPPSPSSGASREAQDNPRKARPKRRMPK